MDQGDKLSALWTEVLHSLGLTRSTNNLMSCSLLTEQPLGVGAELTWEHKSNATITTRQRQTMVLCLSWHTASTWMVPVPVSPYLIIFISQDLWTLEQSCRECWFARLSRLALCLPRHKPLMKGFPENLAYTAWLNFLYLSSESVTKEQQKWLRTSMAFRACASCITHTSHFQVYLQLLVCLIKNVLQTKEIQKLF